MGLYRAFTQQSPIATATTFPNQALPTEATLGTAPALIANARTNRRGLLIANDGNNPLVFSYGSTVSLSLYSARLEPGDIWEDTYQWQGQVSAMNATAAGIANANVTELIVI